MHFFDRGRAIAVFEEILPSGLCDDIVETAELAKEWIRLLPPEGADLTERHTVDYVLMARAFEPKLKDLIKTVMPPVETAFNAYHAAFKFPCDRAEPLVLLRYSPGDKYPLHFEDAPGSGRQASALLYLSGAEGGELYFPRQTVRISPRKNMLVIYPSNYAYSCQTLPVVSGKLYALSTHFGYDTRF